MNKKSYPEKIAQPHHFRFRITHHLTGYNNIVAFDRLGRQWFCDEERFLRVSTNFYQEKIQLIQLCKCKMILIRLIVIQNLRYVWRGRDRYSWHSFSGHLVILRFSANNGYSCRSLGKANLVCSCTTINASIPLSDLGQAQLDGTIVVQCHYCSSTWT